MPREETKPLTLPELKEYIARLERIAAEMRALEPVFESAKELWVFRKPSVEDGVRRLDSFVPELRNSVKQHNIGDPYGPNSTKNRAAKRKAKAKPKRSTKRNKAK